MKPGSNAAACAPETPQKFTIEPGPQGFITMQGRMFAPAKVIEAELVKDVKLNKWSVCLGLENGKTINLQYVEVADASEVFFAFVDFREAKDHA